MPQVTAATKEDGQLCPVQNVLAKVTGKWQCLIVLALEDGPQRFGQIKRLIGDITQRVLTENLQTLERDGYLTRTVHPGPPVAVSYELTDLGQELVGVLKPLVIWASERFDRIIAAREQYYA
ncbi:helix-turn-helix transcriptional regulator [Pelagibius litoralis]|uniref:Helix-turn-helix transcriptional regulator n=1 Tax=Pelagibius litoralis TaxID=374515 RepID=A0A967KA09_9PROT|nr:helix-turn-helix domain-containing protein [Pelagibius litoralis]NIA71368.1 helix-turn-helix transcriptional regulator [Pelagibius litoralis]